MQIGDENILTTFSFATFAMDMFEIERLGREQGLLDAITVHGEASLYSLLKPSVDANRALRRKLADGPYGRVETQCLCGAPDGVPVQNVDRDGFAHPMVMCEECSTIRALHRLDDGSLGAFYRDDYRPIYGGGPAPPFTCEMGLDFAALTEHFQVCTDRVYEVGAGSGEFLESLGPGRQRIGFDLDAEAAARAQARGIDVRTTTTPGFYDLICFHHSLEHLPDPATSIAAARAQLAPGGAIYIGVPGLHRYDHRQLWQLAHLWQWEAKTLAAFMERQGFEAIYLDEGICSLWRPRCDS